MFLSRFRSFLLIWAGQLISAVGSRLSSFALGIWVLRTTGSTTNFAMTFVAMTIPGLLVSTVAGALVDRWDRRHTMISCDVLSAATMLLIAALSATGHLSIWHIYFAVGAASLFDAFRAPAFAASIPLLAPRDQLPRVNGMAQTGIAVAEIIGPLVAGALVSLISLQGIMTVDALTFGVGVATLAAARIPRPVPAARQHRAGLLREAFIGWRYVQERPGLIGLLSIYASNKFLFSIACVVVAPLLLSFSTPARLGMQYAISGCGLLLGGLAITAWGGPRKRIHGVLAFSFLGGVCMAAHGLRPSFALTAVAGFVLFLMLPVISSSNNSIWQAKVPAGLQGRCFAIQRLVFNASTVLGFCLAGPLSKYVFEPLLAPGGPLARSVGWVLGVGPGRGLGLMFIALGALMSFAAVAAYSLPVIRNIDAMPDAFSLPVEAAPPAEAAAAAQSVFALPQDVLPYAEQEIV
ncbi:MAG TPA: MFS transporter [Bryobacteraceae bacterium]|jgi:MFS family permease|nr:MFS transporter [Bryobacteraceae bacterium]